MKYCENCGCILEKSGICSNCHEELFIATYQAEDIEYPLSEEFQEKMAKQNKEIEERK